MVCCALGLMMVCQIFEAWRRMKVWLGMPARAVARAGSMAENLREKMIVLLRRPWFRAVAVVLLTVELSFAGNLLYEHRVHLREAGDTVVAYLRGEPPLASQVCTVKSVPKSAYRTASTN